MRKIFGLNPNVFFLGLVSFFTDISSEMIFTLMPLFLSNILGAATITIGLIEGITESAAALLKVFSGWISDRLGKRNIVTFTGYALSALAKPFMYVASTWGIVVGIRFADRFGKGIRSAPRDALIADSLTSSERGRGFGFHRMMDTAGAAVGLITAAVVVYTLQARTMNLVSATYQTLVIIGVIPAILALFMFIFIRDIRKKTECNTIITIEGKSVMGGILNRRFYTFLVITLIFTLGNSSDAFLILRAQNMGSCVLDIILMLITFNISYALFSIPAGVVSDRLGRKYVIAIGWAIYALTYVGLAILSASWQIWLFFVLYGIYYGLAEGVTRAFVADLVPIESRGMAYGIFHGMVGITLMPASIIGGWLWQTYGPSVTFYAGAGLAALALVLLLLLIRK